MRQNPWCRSSSTQLPPFYDLLCIEYAQLSTQPEPARKIGRPLILAKPKLVIADPPKPRVAEKPSSVPKAQTKAQPVKQTRKAPNKREPGRWQPVNFQNAWITAEDKAKIKLPAWLALIITALVVGGAVSQWTFAYDYIVAQGHLSPLSDITDRALSFALIFSPLIVSYVVLSLVMRRPKVRGGFGLFPALILGLCIGAMGCSICVGSAWALGGAVLVKVPPYSIPLVTGLAIGFGLLLFQVMSEELFFRGWLLPTVAAQWGPSIGLVSSSLIFSALHQIGQDFLPIQFVNQALGGLLFGLLAFRCGSIWAPIGAHMSWNFLYFHLLGLAPNPGSDPLGVVFDFDTVGNPIVFGGTNEMIAGVEVGVVLVLLCATLMLIGPAKPKKAIQTAV
jgi:uncharacterized protein